MWAYLGLTVNDMYTHIIDTYVAWNVSRLLKQSRQRYMYKRHHNQQQH